MNRFLCSSTIVCSVIGLAGFQPANAATLEEVVVTAQKREQSLQDVPVSVTAFSGQSIARQKMRTALDVTAQTPNLHYNGTIGEGQMNLSIRGIAQSDYSFNQSGPVALYVDEVYIGSNTLSAGFLTFDLERIEVLRGPQGTLYGKNTTGGAINFITEKPSFETGGYITAGIGDYGRKEVDAAFEFPVIDELLAVRAALRYVERDGVVENKLPGGNDLNSLDDIGGRISLLWTPTSRTDINLRLYSGSREGAPYAAYPTDVSPAGVGFTGYQRTGLDFHESEVNFDRKHDISLEEIALTINHGIGDFTITSITAWDDGEYTTADDADGAPVQILEEVIIGKTEQFSQDLRLSSEFSGPFNFIAGLYYADETFNGGTEFRYFWEFAATPEDCLIDFFTGCFYRNDFEQTKETQAVYFNSTYDLTENLTVELGLRYTDDESGVSDYIAEFGGIDGQVIAQVFGPLERDLEEDNVSGKIGIDYQFSNGNLLYASYSEGYRSGTFNAQAFFFPSEVTRVNPEEIEAFEIGYKTVLLDGRLRINGAVFNYDYVNQQFVLFDPNTGETQLLNAGASTINGLDLEVVWRPVESTTINLGLGILDTEYDEAIVGFDATGAPIDGSGNELINSPDTNFNVAVTHYMGDLGFGGLTFYIDANYTGDQFFQADNSELTAEDGYWLANARVELELVKDKLGISIWGKNLTDEEYIANSFDLSGFGYIWNTRGAPRTVGAEVHWRF